MKFGFHKKPRKKVETSRLENKSAFSELIAKEKNLSGKHQKNSSSKEKHEEKVSAPVTGRPLHEEKVIQAAVHEKKTFELVKKKKRFNFGRKKVKADIEKPKDLPKTEEKIEILEKKKRFGGLGSLFRKKEIKANFKKFTIMPSIALIEMPSFVEVKKKSVTYPVIKPYATVSVGYDTKFNELVYTVSEPVLTDHEAALLEKLKEGLIQVIDISIADIKGTDKIIDYLEDRINMLINEYDFTITETEYAKILYYIYRDFIGMNEIEPLLKDNFIEDIGCDGVGVPIYVIHQKYGSVKTNVVFNDERKLKEFVTKLAERCNRYISYAEPLLDGTLPDGTRVQATIATDVTTRGPTFNLRKFRESPFTPVDMINLGTASSELLAYLWFVVENGVNILITGGVATGKTSLLNCVSMFIPRESKIVSIEDTRELNLPHENWIPGVARSGFTSSGVGEVTMFELLKESFRQNPDYLIVGEVRGKEAYIMFQGMASGHPSMSTVHSGGVDDLMKRLQTKPISLSPGLLNSLDIVITMVHAREKSKSARRIKEVVEIESIDQDSGIPRINKVFTWIASLDKHEYRGNSWMLSKISSEKGIPMSEIIRQISERKKIIEWMHKSNVSKMEDVVNYIKIFASNPDQMKEIIAK